MNSDYKGAGKFAVALLFISIGIFVATLSYEYSPEWEISKEQYAELESIRMYSVSVVPEYRPAVALTRESLSDGKVTRREFWHIKNLANEGFANLEKRNLQEAKRKLMEQIGPVSAERE